MNIIDKKGLLGPNTNLTSVVLELGCGHRKRHPEAIGIDLRDLPGVDIVGDALDVLRKLKKDTVAGVYSYHFFEHLDNVESYMIELNRLMKENAQIEIITPHFSNPYYYSDHTHKTPFGLYSLAYFCQNTIFQREVPQYNKDLTFELSGVELVFKSSRPFYVRYGIKKVLQFIFNLNRYMMELYEENLCYLFPCYEIRYRLIKK